MQREFYCNYIYFNSRYGVNKSVTRKWHWTQNWNLSCCLQLRYPNCGVSQLFLENHKLVKDYCIPELWICWFRSVLIPNLDVSKAGQNILLLVCWFSADTSSDHQWLKSSHHNYLNCHDISIVCHISELNQMCTQGEKRLLQAERIIICLQCF
jgi:hypothetical protein